ncbi:MAG: DUF3089 domain-containing protein [Novosphingobium sp.]
MARKFLYFIAFCIVLFIGGRIALAFYPEQLTRMSFTPSVKFEPQAPLQPSAYADARMWFARPGQPGEALPGWRPEGLKAGPEAAPVEAAVFFVHPTSYLKKDHWNAPLGDRDAERIGTIVVRGIASVFGEAREVWAPRYRQATFGAFVTDAPEARQAHDLAYRDVAEAFDAFVSAQPADRPIVLSGHSQGSFILKRLLAEKVAGNPLAKRIAAAYVIGWVVDANRDLPRMGLPACARPDQSGCVISFLSFADQADTAMMRGAYERFAGNSTANVAPAYLCSNPLTGGVGGSAPPSANSGGIVPDLKFETAVLTPELVGAACAPDGSLRIGAGPDIGPFVLPGGNYHVYDYALYWLPLRQDFARRVAAWQTAR